MKKVMALLFLFGIFTLTYINRDNLVNYIMTEFINKEVVTEYKNNIYAKAQNVSIYEATDDFTPNNEQDILNIFYTALNGGWGNVVFNCPDEYKECIDDVLELANDRKKLNDVNNYVHPYNSYKQILLSYDTRGQVKVKIKKVYSDSDIITLNKIIDQVIAEKIKSNMSVKEQIRAIHDYIIDHTSYDKKSADIISSGGSVDTNVHKASGPLVEGKAICGGYSDAMALFLNKLNILNYKIASEEHIWNYVYVDNNWYHMDLTWDDTDEEAYRYMFFLITTEKLKKLDPIYHNY